MAHRELSETERSVLAHVELSPDAWWNNACLKFTRAQAETILANKVERWRNEYEAAAAQPNYRSRAERTSL